MTTEVETKPFLETLQNATNAKERHIVARDKNGQFEDKALCGFLWDRIKLNNNGKVCEECFKIFCQRENLGN